MQSLHTRKMFAALLVLPLMLSLSGCGGDARPEFIAPAPERVAQVAVPDVPEGNAPCSGDATRRCLDDEQNAMLLSDYADALDRANAKLQWLADFLFGAHPR